MYTPSASTQTSAAASPAHSRPPSHNGEARDGPQAPRPPRSADLAMPPRSPAGALRATTSASKALPAKEPLQLPSLVQQQQAGGRAGPDGPVLLTQAWAKRVRAGGVGCGAAAARSGRTCRCPGAPRRSGRLTLHVRPA